PLPSWPPGIVRAPLCRHPSPIGHPLIEVAFKAEAEIWFRRRQKTVSIVFRAELTAGTRRDCVAFKTGTPPERVIWRAPQAGSQEPSCAYWRATVEVPPGQEPHGRARGSSRSIRQEEPKGVRAWNCRITAASVLGIEIANGVHKSGHSVRRDRYRNARLVPSRDGTLTWAASSSLTFSRSRSVTSRRNREFSSWSSAIRSAPRVRSGSLASGIATNAG